MACEDCKYFDVLSGYYVCTRNAPSPGTSDYARWPKVQKEWHCGEFTAMSPSGLEDAQSLLNEGTRIGVGENAFSCQDCVYSRFLEGYGVYECHKGTPTATEQNNWPLVNADDFCGSLAIYVKG